MSKNGICGIRFYVQSGVDQFWSLVDTSRLWIGIRQVRPEDEAVDVRHLGQDVDA